MSSHATIVRLLGSLGSDKEVRQYLQHYASADEGHVAVIKVGGQILDDNLDGLAEALGFLAEVNARPVVVHGAGPQLNRALAESGIEPSFHDGQRVTTPDVLEVARRVFHEVNLTLVDALVARGTQARPLTSGVLSAKPTPDSRLGLVGDDVVAHTAALTSCARSGHVPVIAPLAETHSGQILNVNADVATRAITRALGPRKVVFLTPTGGLLDEDGQVLSAINLAEDFDRLMDEPWLAGGMRLKIQQIEALLSELPAESSVSITSPDQLARELFTHRGAGTLVRRGERIQRFDGFSDVDVEGVRALLEQCFGRPLAPDYFHRKVPSAIYLAEGYRAVAIVTEEEGVPYLDKFAVTHQAQGAGVGASLWRRMAAAHPKLFWRSRRTNPINSWYFHQADGCMRDDQWVVFWNGLADLQEIDRLVRCAFAMPASLRDHAEGEA